MARYVALIDGKAGAYGVVFPDLPGCTAMGKTVDQAIANAAEALRDWIEVKEEHGKEPPLRSRSCVAVQMLHKQSAAAQCLPPCRWSARRVSR
jgi:predicted RNase H-like HicB family nuclease